MKKVCFLVFLLQSNYAFAQHEAVYSDLTGCTQFYYHGADVKKEIEKHEDTSAYFHDGELVIYFNQKKVRSLSPNSFYIFNHGFNKLFSMRIVMMEIEASNSKKDKKLFVSSPETYYQAFYQDSLPRCTHTMFSLTHTYVPGYKKAEIKGIFVEIRYYNEHIFKWFLREPETLDELIPMQWRINK